MTSICVTGAAETSAAFADYGRDIHREIAEADRRVASQTAEDAISAANSLGGVAAHVAPSIDASGADVTLGGSAWPMAAGAEFGRDAFAQFDAWRGSGETAGYFLVPSIKRGEADRLREYESAAEAAGRDFSR